MGWTSPKTWLAAKLTVSDMNIYNRDNMNYLKANIGLGAPAELTIDTGSVTKTKSYHTIDTEGDAATDDLDTIAGGSDGDIVFIQAEHDDRTVVVKNETDNIHTGADIYLDTVHKVIALVYDATLTEWHLAGGVGKIATFLENTFTNPSSDWVMDATGATLAQNKAAKEVYIPLTFLKLGDQIVSYKLVGDATEGTALTLDCKLIRINKADPITETDVAGGAITQIAAGGNFDSAATLTAAETIATDKQYVLQITATTTGGDSIVVMGAEVEIVRLG